jgi:hypothetical protein
MKKLFDEILDSQRFSAGLAVGKGTNEAQFQAMFCRFTIHSQPRSTLNYTLEDDYYN